MKAGCSIFVVLVLWAGILLAGMAHKKITFRVHVPDDTPASDKIYITGNQKNLGNWEPGKVALQKVGDREWEITLEFPVGTHVEYKITRGSWVTEATEKDSTIPGNRMLEVSEDEVVKIDVPHWRDIIFKIAGGITGTVKYHEKFYSLNLDNERTLVILLPPSYETEADRRYPVLYMHDGQNIFDPSTSFAGVDWQVDETVDSLVRKGKMEEIIVVGVYNTKDRLEEYANTKKGRAYMKFLIHEVKPFIDRTYRTLPDRRHTAVMGSSMGGLISFYLVWLHPDVFYQAACLSSSFRENHEDAFHQVKRYKGQRKDIRIYFDNGSVGLEGEYTPYFERMRYLLIAKGFELGKDLEYFYDEGGDHSERAWAKRLWRPLMFMFGKAGG